MDGGKKIGLALGLLVFDHK